MRDIASILRFLSVAVVCGLLLCGCAYRGRVEIGLVELRPASTVAPGSQVELTAFVRGAPSGTVFRFTPHRVGDVETNRAGVCLPDSFPGGVYTTFYAPTNLGPVDILVEAVLGERVLTSRVCRVTVAEMTVPVPVAPPSPASTPNSPAYFVSTEFIPSGFMGDASGDTNRLNVQFDLMHRQEPFSPPTCQRWGYVDGDLGWAAVAWQLPESNWGQYPGKDLSRHAFTKLTFAARGLDGGEVVEFFAGGRTTPGLPHQASFAMSDTFVLSQDWREYSLDVSGLDLSSTICAFGWTVRNRDVPVTFFLDDVRYAP